MFEKRHRITLLFNANKAYDRQVVEGVGEYLQASQSEWDIFMEEDFRTRIENIREWLGDGVIADFDDPEIEQLLKDVQVPIVASAALIIGQSIIRRCTTSRQTTMRW
ncbi:Xylose activator XylR (AraC family) [Cronobacter dublinensis 1210]|uniref:Xylose activator XylR (AraC family) n=1 Tax=Cronobacter dublinensis 1210 TaxID=1208656 RepID=A0ABM9Q5Z2_9ENTR|nr:Xylose activator XylR (AraC family) [Cronobacter dublinensis 1210]